jgi:hypothetical protein
MNPLNKQLGARMFEVIQLTTNRRWATMGDMGYKKMDRATFSSLKVDRTAFTVASLEDGPGDKDYWLLRTPHELLRHIERFHRTLLDEHLRTKGCTTWYETVGEMQEDMETYLEHYNRRRPHRGRGTKGRTPYQVFTETLPRTPRGGDAEGSLGSRPGRSDCQVITVLIQALGVQRATII